MCSVCKDFSVERARGAHATNIASCVRLQRTSCNGLGHSVSCPDEVFLLNKHEISAKSFCSSYLNIYVLLWELDHDYGYFM